ncbi:hypothetical protein OQA88_12063 [Cercophora sp. LCS_1]
MSSYRPGAGGEGVASLYEVVGLNNLPTGQRIVVKSGKVAGITGNTAQVKENTEHLKNEADTQRMCWRSVALAGSTSFKSTYRSNYSSTIDVASSSTWARLANFWWRTPPVKAFPQLADVKNVIFLEYAERGNAANWIFHTHSNNRYPINEDIL